MHIFSKATAVVVVALVIAAVAQAMGTGMGGHHARGAGMHGAMMAAPVSLGDNPVPRTEDAIAKGNTLYDTNCAVCHGALGRGDGSAAAAFKPRPSDLRGTVSSWYDGQIAALIISGRGAMPAYRNILDDEAVWSVVHYLRRLQGQ
ncbi:MAG: mono/diheme cytochrome c family protein [Gammaproteobacteria bacterium]|jgi:mono/diheme cytochrome c family protein